MNILPWNLFSNTHPLSRKSHCSIRIGRYVFIIGGASVSTVNISLHSSSYECIGLLRYDTLCNTYSLIRPAFDYFSFKEHFISPDYLILTSSAACVRHLQNKQSVVYVFGGYSLRSFCHTNVLQEIVLRHVDTTDQMEDSFLPSLPSSWKIISGNGFISHCSERPNLLRFALYFLINEFVRTHIDGVSRLESFYTIPALHSNMFQPSPRDKATFECFEDKLYLFGGFGPSPKPPDIWPDDIFHWPFLSDQAQSQEWHLFEDKLGWNNQLLIYNTLLKQWILWKHQNYGGHLAPAPRAAHGSCVDYVLGNMFIFGGRSFAKIDQYGCSIPMGRRHDLYMFSFRSLQWTEINTQNCPYDLWPPGLSWVNFNLIKTVYEPRTDIFKSTLVLYGGQLNQNFPSNDVYLIDVDLKTKNPIMRTKRKDFFRYSVPNLEKITPEFSHFNIEKVLTEIPTIFSKSPQNLNLQDTLIKALQNDFLLNPEDQEDSFIAGNFKTMKSFETIANLLTDGLTYMLKLAKFSFSCSDEQNACLFSGVEMFTITYLSLRRINIESVGKSYLFDLVTLLTPWECMRMILLEKDCWIESSELVSIWHKILDSNINSVNSDDISIFFDFEVLKIPCDMLRDFNLTFNSLIMARFLRERLCTKFQGVFDWFLEMIIFDKGIYKSTGSFKEPGIIWEVPTLPLDARCWHTGTTLLDGSILVIGGQVANRANQLNHPVLLIISSVPSLKVIVEKHLAKHIICQHETCANAKVLKSLEYLKSLPLPAYRSLSKWF